MVEKLASPDWTTREDATEELKAAGFPALPSLARARDHEDAEVRWRVASLARAIGREVELRRRNRLLRISPGEEARARGENRVDLALFRSERGHYSGSTRLLPLFGYEYDEKLGQEDLCLWPLATRWRSDPNELTFYSFPFFHLKTRREPRLIQFLSLPVIYTYSKEDDSRSFWVPPLLSGFSDSPRKRKVSIFPLLYHSVDHRRDREDVWVWPLLTKVERRGERYSVGLLFSLLFEYTYDPNWQEVRIFWVLRFRWGERFPD